MGVEVMDEASQTYELQISVYIYIYLYTYICMLEKFMLILLEDPYVNKMMLYSENLGTAIDSPFLRIRRTERCVPCSKEQV